MVPKNNGSKPVLICRGCGKEKKKVKIGEYTITEAPKNKHADVFFVEEESKANTDENRKYMYDLYGYGGDSDFED
jgi:DNA-directed RNA polymerase subunit M/transcription elongation factor TFIIS